MVAKNRGIVVVGKPGFHRREDHGRGLSCTSNIYSAALPFGERRRRFLAMTLWRSTIGKVQADPENYIVLNADRLEISGHVERAEGGPHW